MTSVYRPGRQKVKKQNTYQICPSPFFTLRGQEGLIRAILQNHLQTFVEEATLDENGRLEASFTDFLNNLKESILIKQQRFFPRHKIIVHGICGSMTDKLPSLCFGTHAFMSLDCGDDVIGVNYSNADVFAAVCVAGFAQD